MRKSFSQSFFIFLVFIGGLLIAALTMFLIACLHIIKLIFRIFIQREKSSSKSGGSTVYHYSESANVKEPEMKRRTIKTIDAEVVSAETKTINS